MSQPVPRPPGPIRRLLRRLLPGARGAEILEELDREYASLCEHHPRPITLGWYVAQLLHPGTWRLAWALRRTRNVEEGAALDQVSDLRGTNRLSGLSLDLKLAWRMMVKSPGLSVVGCWG